MREATDTVTHTANVFNWMQAQARAYTPNEAKRKDTFTFPVPPEFDWSEAQVALVINRVNADIAAQEARLESDLKAPDEALIKAIDEQIIHNVSLLLPLHALPRLKDKLWRYTTISYDKNKVINEGAEPIVRVTFLSAYRKYIFDAIMRITKGQMNQRAKQRSRHLDGLKNAAAPISSSYSQARNIVSAKIIEKWMPKNIHGSAKPLYRITIALSDTHTATGSLPQRLAESKVGDTIHFQACFKRDSDRHFLFRNPRAL